MTFKERFLRGECSMDVIDDWVTAWRQAGLTHHTLLPVLGLTEEEYRAWAVLGSDALVKRLAGNVDTSYIALYLDWDDLSSQLRNLVRSLLGTDYGITIRREDYYYWNMKFSFPEDMNEEASEKICFALDVQDFDVHHFVWSDDLPNEQLNGLLSKLVQREVESNHADDYGVWLICKDGRIPVREDV